MTIRNLISAYCGTDEYRIGFYCLNNSDYIEADIGDLFTDDRFADILDCKIEQWEFQSGGMAIMYHND